MFTMQEQQQKAVKDFQTKVADYIAGKLTLEELCQFFTISVSLLQEDAHAEWRHLFYASCHAVVRYWLAQNQLANAQYFYHRVIEQHGLLCDEPDPLVLHFFQQAGDQYLEAGQATEAVWYYSRLLHHLPEAEKNTLTLVHPIAQCLTRCERQFFKTLWQTALHSVELNRFLRALRKAAGDIERIKQVIAKKIMPITERLIELGQGDLAAKCYETVFKLTINFPADFTAELMHKAALAKEVVEVTAENYKPCWYQAWQVLYIAREHFKESLLQNHSLKEAQEHYTKAIINELLKPLLQQLQQRLLSEPCAYAVLGLGSVSRGLAPYSDVDMALLVKDDAYRTHPYFAQMLSALQFVLNSLGEPWLIRGDVYQPIAGIDSLETLSYKEQYGLHIDQGDVAKMQGERPVLCQSPVKLAACVMGAFTTEDKKERAEQSGLSDISLAYALLRPRLLLESSQEANLYGCYQQELTYALSAQAKAYYKQVSLLSRKDNRRTYQDTRQKTKAAIETLDIKKQYVSPLTYACLDLGVHFYLTRQDGLLLRKPSNILQVLQERQLVATNWCEALRKTLFALEKLRCDYQIKRGRQPDILYRRKYKDKGLVLSRKEEQQLQRYEAALIKPLYQALAVLPDTRTGAAWDPLLSLCQAIAEKYSSVQLLPLAQWHWQQKIINVLAEHRIELQGLGKIIPLSKSAEDALETLIADEWNEELNTLLRSLRQAARAAGFTQATREQHIIYAETLPRSVRLLWFAMLTYNLPQYSDPKTCTAILEALAYQVEIDGYRLLKDLQQTVWYQQLHLLVTDLPERLPVHSVTITLHNLEDPFDPAPKTYVLKPDVKQQLFKRLWFKPHNPQQKGNHTVLPIKISGIQFWCKLCPEQPSMEAMIEELSWAVSPGGTPSQMVAKVQHGDLVTAVQLFAHVPGEDMESCFKYYPDYFARIHPESFIQTLLRILLTNPEDDKDDDYFLVEQSDGFRLVRIDNERAFFQPDDREGKFLFKPKLQVKSILYCLDEMLTELDPQSPALQAFCRIGPLAFLQRWVDYFSALHEHYRQLFTEQDIRRHFQLADRDLQAHLRPEKTFYGTTGSPKNLCLLAAGLAPALVKEQLNRWTAMQTVIRLAQQNGCRLSGNSLLETIQAPLAAYYRHIFEQFPINPEVPERAKQRFQQVTRGLYKVQPGGGSLHTKTPGLKAITASLQLKAGITLADALAIARGEQQSPEQIKAALEAITQQALDNILQGLLALDLAAKTVFQGCAVSHQILILRQVERVNLPVEHQAFILQAMVGIPFHDLRIAPFQKALADERLMPLLQKAGRHLMVLEVVASEAITNEFFAITDALFAVLEEHCPQLQVLILRDVKGIQNLSVRRMGYFNTPLSLPYLQTLDIQRCANLQQIDLLVPRLSRLQLTNCDRLQTIHLQPRVLANLTVAIVVHCSVLSELDLPGPMLSHLDLSGSSGLRHFKIASERLRKLSLEGCIQLPTAEIEALVLRHVERLQWLSLADCHQVAIQRIARQVKRIGPNHVLLKAIGQISEGNWYNLPLTAESVLALGDQSVELQRIDVRGGVSVALAEVQQLLLKQPRLEQMRWTDWQGPAEPAETVSLEGHRESVTALTVLPDGRVVSGSADHTLRVWEEDQSGVWYCTHTLEGHRNCVRALTALPDGRVISGSDDKTLGVWKEGQSGSWRCTHMLKGHHDCVLVLTVLPDSRVVSGSSDKTLGVWAEDQSGSWRCTHTLKGHYDYVLALTVLPDGRMVSGSKDAKLRVWAEDQSGSWRCTYTLEGHEVHATALTVLPDGRVLSGSDDKTLRVWAEEQSGSWRCTHTLKGHDKWVLALTVLPDGRVVSGSDDKTLRVWAEEQSGLWRCTYTLKEHRGFVSALTVLPDGRVVSGSADNTLRVWNFYNRQLDLSFKATLYQQLRWDEVDVNTIILELLSNPSREKVQPGALLTCKYALQLLLPDAHITCHEARGLQLENISPSGIRFLLKFLAPYDVSIRTKATHQELLSNWLARYPITSLVLSHSNLAAFAHWDWRLIINSCVRRIVLSATEGTIFQQRLLLKVGSPRFFSLTMFLDGRVISGSDDKTLCVWAEDQPGAWRCMHTLGGHCELVSALTVLPDGRVVSGSMDKTLRVWEELSGEWRCIHTLEGHRASVFALTVLPDGRVVSGSGDETLQVWEEQAGVWHSTHTLEGHRAAVFALTVLPDGRVVSGSGDETLQVWEEQAGVWHSTHTLEGHRGPVYALTVLPDGRVVSGTLDATLQVWEEQAGVWHSTHTLEGHRMPVFALTVLPDGRVVSGSWDDTLRVWEEQSGVWHSTHTLEGHRHSVRSLTVLPDGRVVSGSEDATLRVWEEQAGVWHNTHTLERYCGIILALTVLPDGRVVSGSRDKTLRVWDVFQSFNLNLFRQLQGKARFTVQEEHCLLQIYLSHVLSLAIRQHYLTACSAFILSLVGKLPVRLDAFRGEIHFITTDKAQQQTIQHLLTSIFSVNKATVENEPAVNESLSLTHVQQQLFFTSVAEDKKQQQKPTDKGKEKVTIAADTNNELPLVFPAQANAWLKFGYQKDGLMPVSRINKVTLSIQMIGEDLKSMRNALLEELAGYIKQAIGEQDMQWQVDDGILTLQFENESVTNAVIELLVQAEFALTDYPAATNLSNTL